MSIISFIHPLIHPSIHSFSHPSILSFIHSHVHLFVRSFTHLSIRPFVHSSIHTFTHLSIHSFTHSFIHSFIYPPIRVKFFVHKVVRTDDPFLFLCSHCSFLIAGAPTTRTAFSSRDTLLRAPSPRNSFRCPTRSRVWTEEWVRNVRMPMCQNAKISIFLIFQAASWWWFYGAAIGTSK